MRVLDEIMWDRRQESISILQIKTLLVAALTRLQSRIFDLFAFMKSPSF